MPNATRGGADKPLVYDPFTGRRFEIKGVPQQGSFIARTDKYFVGPFKTLGGLLVHLSMRDGVMPRFAAKNAETLERVLKPAQRSPIGASVPIKTCPFSKKPLVIEPENKSDPASRWMVQGDHYLIYGFATRRAAEYFVSTRDGVTPEFSLNHVEVVRAEGDLGPEDLDDVHEGTGVDEARKASDVLTDVGIGKPQKEE